jgi:hypothetical protein
MVYESLFDDITDPRLRHDFAVLYGHMCRHLVGIGIEYIDLDQSGKSIDGLLHFLMVSAFATSFHGGWFLVSAGHVFEDALDTPIAEGKRRVERCYLADFFGKDATIRNPTPFYYDSDLPRRYVYDRDWGMDIGIIPLSYLFQQGLEKNGIQPFSEQDWITQHRIDFEHFAVLGFPDSIVQEHSKPIPIGRQLQASVAPVLVGIEPIKRSDVPDSVEFPNSELPWFIGRILPKNAPHFAGMSGAPIFGMVKQPNGGLKYWPVAVQSSCFHRHRIILGCPVAIFARMLSTEITEILSREPPTHQP